MKNLAGDEFKMKNLTALHLLRSQQFVFEL